MGVRGARRRRPPHAGAPTKPPSAARPRVRGGSRALLPPRPRPQPYGNSSEIVPRYLGFTAAIPPENSIYLGFDPESGSSHPRDSANPSQACDSRRPPAQLNIRGTSGGRLTRPRCFPASPPSQASRCHATRAQTDKALRLVNVITRRLRSAAALTAGGGAPSSSALADSHKTWTVPSSCLLSPKVGVDEWELLCSSPLLPAPTLLLECFRTSVHLRTHPIPFDLLSPPAPPAPPVTAWRCCFFPAVVCHPPSFHTSWLAAFYRHLSSTPLLIVSHLLPFPSWSRR